MSKLLRPVFGQMFPILLLFLVVGIVLPGVSAQNLSATLEIDVPARRAQVKGRFTDAGERPRNLSFQNLAIGAEGLGSRITNVELSGDDGSPVSFDRLNPSEFAAEAGIVGFDYSVDLAPLKDPRSAAHASWISDEFGIIFLSDILPQSLAGGGRKAVVSFRTQAGWQFESTEPEVKGFFVSEDRGRAVFVIGKEIRRVDPPRKGEPTLLVRGKWLHTDTEAAEMTQEIYREYLKLFGRPASGNSMAVLFPFPQEGVGHGTWEAETRGDTVLIASGGMAFEYQAKQRLHEQLRHEIFHLWIPNAVGLTGPYDWFYEGFAMYVSLKTAVSLRRIRFDDMLDTLSRAYRIDRSAPRRRSLVESSRERWSGGETEVYARGMLAAFLSDLALLNGPGNTRSVEDLLRALVQKHAFLTVSVDGNSAVLESMNAIPALRNITSGVILGSEPVDWDRMIANAGLAYSSNREGPGLSVTADATRRQRSLLRKLGYNGR